MHKGNKLCIAKRSWRIYIEIKDIWRGAYITYSTRRSHAAFEVLLVLFVCIWFQELHDIPSDAILFDMSCSLPWMGLQRRCSSSIALLAITKEQAKMRCMFIYHLSGEFVVLEKVDRALLRLVHMSIGLLRSAHASMHEEQCLAFVGNLSEKKTYMDYILIPTYSSL